MTIKQQFDLRVGGDPIVSPICQPLDIACQAELASKPTTHHNTPFSRDSNAKRQ